MTRRISFALATAAVVLLIIGTGGFSSVNADRNVGAAVVNDDRAYLGIDTYQPTGTVYGNPVTILELTDRFADDVWLDKATLINNPSLVDLETTGQNNPAIGESNPLSVKVRCEDPGSTTLDTLVTAKGSGTTAEVTRETGVTCTLPSVKSVVDVTFDGCGNAHVSTNPEAHYPIHVTKVINTTNGIKNTGMTLDSDGNVHGSSGGKLIALEISLRGDSPTERFDNPNTCSDPGNSNSGGNKQGTETSD